jgi:hypothetical protein
MTGVVRGLQADPRAGSARDEKKPAIDYAQSGKKNMLICRNFTGATGLEPATSGVTGMFQGNDD